MKWKVRNDVLDVFQISSQANFNTSFRNSLFSFSKNKRPKTYVVNGKVIKVFFFYIYFWLGAKAKRSLVFVLGLWTQKQGLHLWIHSDVP